MQQAKEPIVLTGRTWVSGALANIFESRALVQRNVQKGDMKLWCHLRKGARVWSGQFRAAVYDGRGWRTFKLNIVADSDARYDSFDERTSKARRVFDAIWKLKGQTARYFEQSATYGCTFTLAVTADTVPAPASGATTGGTAARPSSPAEPKSVHRPEAARTSQTVSAPTDSQGDRRQEAARTAQPPATGTQAKVTSSRRRGGRGRRRRENPGQLTLF